MSITADGQTALAHVSPNPAHTPAEPAAVAARAESLRKVYPSAGTRATGT